MRNSSSSELLELLDYKLNDNNEDKQQNIKFDEALKRLKYSFRFNKDKTAFINDLNDICDYYNDEDTSLDRF